MRPVLAATAGLFLATSLACAKLEDLVPSDLVSSEPQTVRARDMSCEVTIPSDWATLLTLSDEAAIQVWDRRDDLYGVVLVDSIADLASDVTVDLFSEYARAGIVERTRNCDQTGPVYLTVGERPAVQWELTCDVDALRIGYLHTVIAGERHYFQVLAWSAASSFVGKKSELAALTESLRELPEAVPIPDGVPVRP